MENHLFVDLQILFQVVWKDALSSSNFSASDSAQCELDGFQLLGLPLLHRSLEGQAANLISKP